LFLEDSECKLSLLMNLLWFDLRLWNWVSFFTNAILLAESKLTDVNCSVLPDLSSPTLRQSINEPTLVNKCVSRVFATLELQNPSKPVEVLWVDEHLPIVDVVMVLSDAHELKLQPVWCMNLRAVIGVSNVVKLWHFTMVRYPGLLLGEEVSWHWPRHKFAELPEILSEILDDDLILHQASIMFSILNDSLLIRNCWSLLCFF